MKKIIILIVLTCSIAANAVAEECNDYLFYISKSHNKNVLYYAANFDGLLLDAKDPVRIYWVMNEKDGHIEGLTMLEKPQFGIKTEELERGVSYIIHVRNSTMSDHPIYVAIDDDGCPRAKTQINGKLAYLDSVYLEVKEKGLLYSVPHLDFFGHDPETGEKVTERLYSK